MKTTQESNNSRRKSMLPWLVWGLGCAFYFYEVIVRASPNVMSHELMRDFNITAVTMGLLTSFYFWTYALFQIPAGLFLDKLGPHKLLTYSTFICGIGAVLFGITELLSLASVGRLLIGFGSAFAAIGTMKLAANWFPASRFTFLTGLMVAAGSLGGVFGEYPLAVSVHSYGWRATMIALGIAGIFLAVLIYKMVRDEPDSGSQTGHDSKSQDMTAILSDLGLIVRNKQIWLTAFYGGLMYAPIPIFCDIWSAAFLMAKYSITKQDAALMASMVYYGLIVGSPLGGYISDTLRRRKPTMLVATIGCIVTISIAIYAPISITMMYIVLFLFGFSTAGFLPAFSIVREISPQKSTATALGFMNMMNMIFIVFVAPAIGVILDKVYSGIVGEGVRLYSYADYQAALWLIPAGLAIALLLMPFIKETYCRIDSGVAEH